MEKTSFPERMENRLGKVYIKTQYSGGEDKTMSFAGAHCLEDCRPK